MRIEKIEGSIDVGTIKSVLANCGPVYFGGKNGIYKVTDEEEKSND